MASAMPTSAIGFKGICEQVSEVPALALRGQGQRETFAWAPVPVTPNAWVAPNKPHWKLSELLAPHKGQAQPGRQTVVADNLLQADYVQMAPGTKTKRQFHADNRVWWVVQGGKIRFTIEGQDPIVATKGFLVQVPYRNIYSMEVVGNDPALFLEVTTANPGAVSRSTKRRPLVQAWNSSKCALPGRATTTTEQALFSISTR